MVRNIGIPQNDVNLIKVYLQSKNKINIKKIITLLYMYYYYITKSPILFLPNQSPPFGFIDPF